MREKVRERESEREREGEGANERDSEREMERGSESERNQFFALEGFVFSLSIDASLRASSRSL